LTKATIYIRSELTKTDIAANEIDIRHQLDMLRARGEVMKEEGWIFGECDIQVSIQVEE
jgi:hypothetical protein